MTHLVIGYPSMFECFKLITEMDKAGVDMIELQVPSINAALDGHTIKYANDYAIANGVDVEQCFEFALYLSGLFLIPFVFVCYHDTIKNYGFNDFFIDAKRCNVSTIIIPDIPEKNKNHLHKLAFTLGSNITPVLFPETANVIDIQSLKYSEFCYCATHAGATGDSVCFDMSLLNYIKTVKKNIDKPIAVGFGIKNKSHIDFLKGRADIAVIGTKIMQIIEMDGIKEARRYLETLS